MDPITPRNRAITMNGEYGRARNGPPLVACTEAALVEGREVVLVLQRGIQAHEAVAVVGSACVGIEGAVTAHVVQVSAAVGVQPGVATPDPSLYPIRSVVVGIHLLERGPVVGVAEDPAVIVPVVTERGEGDIDFPVREYEPGALPIETGIEADRAA